MSDALDTALEATADLLRAALNASRVTVRLADDEGNGRLVAESVAAGQVRLSTQPPIDTADQMTYPHVIATAEVLVQSDCRTDPIRPPAELVDAYGVRAQIVAPIKRSDRVRGALSIHQAGHVRDWSGPEIDLVKQAELVVETLLARGALGKGGH
ncbi:GAF domain-containing protein [Streptomyces sp. NPDC002346]